LDVNDRCRNVPRTRTAITTKNGCPKSTKTATATATAIPDSRDKCPDVRKHKDGFQDEDGLPAIRTNDQDASRTNKDQ